MGYAVEGHPILGICHSGRDSSKGVKSGLVGNVAVAGLRGGTPNGGEGGIRTHEPGSPSYALSRRACSTTPAPLQGNDEKQSYPSKGGASSPLCLYQGLQLSGPTIMLWLGHDKNRPNNIVANTDFFVAKVVRIIRVVRAQIFGVWLAAHHDVSRRWLRFHGLFSFRGFHGKVSVAPDIRQRARLSAKEDTPGPLIGVSPQCAQLEHARTDSGGLSRGLCHWGCPHRR